MRRLTILLVAMCFTAIAYAQSLSGTVKDETGEWLTGASVSVVGTTNGVNVDLDGRYTLKNVKKGQKVKFSFIGYQSQTVDYNGEATLDIVLKEESHNLEEAVVTAMGIVRKATSLTYSTQQLKSDDLMKVQDANPVNNIEGKVSGVTITPSAGGAGGATKILLRGNKSIMGSNDPLIVVDGVPMSNDHGSVDAMNLATTSVAEGGDALSMINPDDIESMNVLKGANAAALYGSKAANGVIMITTKKGKEGRLDVNFNSNVTFDTPLCLPKIQNVYGMTVVPNQYDENGVLLVPGSMSEASWGPRMSGENTKYSVEVPSATDFKSGVNTVYLRNKAVNDAKDFLKTGVTTNNSISLSGGTEKIKTYFSYANAHSNGMIETNKYNRNTLGLHQNYTFWKRLNIDVNANYVTTRTKHRVGGGTVGNPLYDVYTLGRNVDLDYYRNAYTTNGEWWTAQQKYYVLEGGGYVEHMGQGLLKGQMQNWAYQQPMKNNPYWLMNMNGGEQKEDRFYGNLQAKIDIWDGLAFQARVSIDHDKLNSESRKTATTWDPADMNEYGRYWLSDSRTNEVYTDYLLSYNKVFKEDWSVSATAGWVGHTIKGTTYSTDATATIDRTGAIVKDETLGITTMSPISTDFNIFDPQAGGPRITSKSKSSNWDKAALFTAQLGWKDMIYIDGSYRRDWYRAFRQPQFIAQGAPDNYGYFGVGGTAVLSELFKLAEPVSYLKYRVSYSEVGNSIPNVLFTKVGYNVITGAANTNSYNSFYPYPEKNKSFETGFESQFFHSTLNFDVTYYNAALCHSYLTVAQGGRAQVVNTGKVRNQGIEITAGYDWMIGGGWRWKTSVNFSFNANKVVKTYTDKTGRAKEMDTSVANGVHVRYIEGGKYGDMYVNDYDRWMGDVYQYIVEGQDLEGNPTYTPVLTNNPNDPAAGNAPISLLHKDGDVVVNNGVPSFNGNFKYVNETGQVLTKLGSSYGRYLGNMNSAYQLSWSNTFAYKNFTLYFLINGRIGGKVISLTESYLDRLGVSQRTADARMQAEANGIQYAMLDAEGNKTGEMVPGMYVNEGRDLVPVQGWYETLGGGANAADYVYSATNFRLRELSFGYTWRDLFGDGKNLSLSAIGRNLFFIYKKAPVDPDVSLSSGNGLGGFEMFNLPSSRSFGINLKLNF